MNDVKMSGRLTSNPEITVRKKDDKDIYQADFSLAVARKYNRDITDFFSCRAYGKRAEFVEKYLKKGTKIIISGELHQERWEDKDTGKAREKDRIYVSDIEFAESKQNEGQPVVAEKPDIDISDIPDEFLKDLPFAKDIEVLGDEPGTFPRN